MEKIIVIAIVASSALYLLLRLRKTLKGGGCSDGCSGCSMAKSCSEKQDREEL